MGFKEQLNKLRLELGMTQKDLAYESKLSPQCISQLEKGTRYPTGFTLVALADCLECSTDYLLGREDDFGNINIQTNKPAPLPQDEQKLLDTYRQLDAVNKLHVSAYAEVRLEEQNFSFVKQKR